MVLPWRLRAALQPLRQRGFGSAAALLRQLPAALALRAWRRVARPLNRSVFGRASNSPRLARFQDRLPASALPRLYVTVMPNVLHFLLPCLALLRGHAQLVLLANGAQSWELRCLSEHLPEAPLFKLQRLPASSVEHGDVISLLIEHQRGCFGIVDHDCYLFDRSLLQQLEPSADECLLTLFSDRHPHTGIDLPLTHFLFFNAPLLQALGREHGVGARVYRHTPHSAQSAFERLGLPADTYLKPYQRFHDTLHVLLVLALARGKQVRLLQAAGELPFAHVGGTSIGSHHTKGLFALHTHLRFIELLGDAELSRRYRFITQPLTTAGETLALRRDGDAAWDGLPLLDQMMPLLAEALHQAWPQRYPPGPDEQHEPTMNDNKPFRILGLQQVAIGGPDKQRLKSLWVDMLGLSVKSTFVSERENVDEDICALGQGVHAVEVDLMQPLDPDKKPAVHTTPLNHVGLWVDDLPRAVEWMTANGVRFAPGGIRKGAAGHDICFIHPKGNEQFPIGGEGVLIELVQAPPDVVAALA